MIRELLLLLLLLAASPARAALTAEALDAVRAEPPAGATLDLGLDKPTIVVFADFDCGVLCDAILGQTGQELVETQLTPGADYRIAVIGIDPRDDLESGSAFVAAQLPSELLEAAIVRAPDEDTVSRITQALGYGYVYDAGSDRFAHPAVRYMLSPSGRMTAVLPPFEVTPDEMRQAIDDARDEEPSVVETLILLCYGLDPASGRYTPLVLRAITVLGCLTLVALSVGLAVARARERRRHRA
jgi:protein SCO1